ncbi:hypothetical protein KV100_07580 [Mumia sp. zg.B21]|uniref:hypothetical protein n=1 Tax=Mumia sp. zg.B21 TaxID=2855447 RepID=UPI001C6DFB47|nr:hypothetical protein [Mumia sp. zg.B21]MBW9209513.1 hypothetical protein [Mumia sp. zg.B21]
MSGPWVSWRVEEALADDAALPDNLSLIGGEMELWADGVPEADPVRAAVVATTVPAGAEVLVAGPHALDVLGAVQSLASRTTIVVRGQRDALTIARAMPEVTVWCGDLERIDLERLRGGKPFSAVVALGDVSVLGSYDLEPRSWQTYADLLHRLAPAGTLAVGVTNALAATEAASLTPRALDDSDAAWSPAEAQDASRPRSPRQAREAFSAGDTPVTLWSVFPTADHPTIAFASTDDTAPTSGTLASSLLYRETAEAPGRYASDPAWLVRTAVAARTVTMSAAAWLVVRAPADPATEMTLVVGNNGVAEQIPPATAREPAATLEELMLEACLAQDVPALRTLVSRYAEEVAGGGDDQRPSNIAVTTSGSFRPLTYRPRRETEGDPFLDGLYDVARRLFVLGWRNPFPLANGPAENAALMAGYAGRDLSTAEVDVLAARARTELEQAEPTPALVSRLLARTEALVSRDHWLESAVGARDRQLLRYRQQQMRPDPAAERRAAKREARLQQRIASLEAALAARPTGRPLRRLVKRVGRRLRR